MMPYSAKHVDIVKPTVFYDGSCPLCSREIRHYRRLRGAGQIMWVDVSAADASLPHGLNRESAMARFHVLDAGGEWQTGAYGFAELWSHLPAYRWLSILLQKLRLLPLLNRFYSRFARWRLNRSCTEDSCGMKQ